MKQNLSRLTGTVTDKATCEKGTLPSVGIPYVVVNGTIVVKNSQVLEGVTPGDGKIYKNTLQ